MYNHTAVCDRVRVRDSTTLINFISGLGGGKMGFHQNRHQIIIKVQTNKNVTHVYYMNEVDTIISNKCSRVNLNFPKGQ